MGSGCNKNKTGSKCFQRVSDCCVTYTGPEIPLLGICTGDELCEVTAVILAQLDTIMKGADLTLLDLNCDFIKSQMGGKNKNLFTLLQVMIDSHCTLKQMVDSLNTELHQAVTFDLKCITPTAPTVPGTVQGLINAVCVMRTEINTLQDQINDSSDISTTIDARAGNMIHTAINSCGGYGLKKTGSGSDAKLDISAFVPPFCPIPCFAPLSNFSAAGVGLPDSAFCGYYICNGSNGTPDMRGYTFAGAVNLPGIGATGSLDARVDPIVQGSPYSSNILSKSGTVQEKLSIAQMPSHQHPIDEHGGHVHTTDIWGAGGETPGKAGFMGNANTNASSKGTGYTHNNQNQFTNITIGSVGGDQAHNNVQPTIYGYWIMRLS